MLNLNDYQKKQQRFSEADLTCQKAKKEMYVDIDQANVRSNIDSAKKRACLQHMDYDGFHQMVLGANLFPIKKGAIDTIYRESNWENNINHTATYRGIVEKGYDETIVKNTLDIKLEESLNAPKNSEEFEKFVMKKCRDPL